MKILVCVKEVPDLDPEVELEIDESMNWFKEDESSRYMMNRFDEFALEEALLIKEAFPDATIDALTVGEQRSEAVVRRSLGMGADHGIHVVTSARGYPDAMHVASLVAACAARQAYDLILTGVMAEDTQQGQTGPMLAEMLKLPWATSVIQTDGSKLPTGIRVEREIEGGMRDTLELKLPCLLTIQSGINQPRYPALSKVLRAKKADLEIWQASTLSSEPVKHQVREVVYPQKQRAGTHLEGTASEKAATLINLLLEKSYLQ